MVTSDNSDPSAGKSESEDKLTRFSNAMGATLVGVLVTSLALWLVAATLRMNASGWWYLVLFLVATCVGYRGVKWATAALPGLRAAILVAGLVAVALLSVNWRLLGAEDPYTLPFIAALFLGLGYWITGLKPRESVR